MLNKAKDTAEIIMNRPKIVNKEFEEHLSKKVLEKTHIGSWKTMEGSWSTAASQSECNTQTATDQSERVYSPDVRALRRNINKPKSYISFGKNKGAIHSSAADERTSSPLFESRKRRYQRNMARTKQTDRQLRASGHHPATVPATCPVCNRSCSQRTNLERHMALKGEASPVLRWNQSNRRRHSTGTELQHPGPSS